MAVISRVNPNFPVPGIDQSSKGFRDNFATIKNEIENLQGKSFILTGDVQGGPVMIDSGTSPIIIPTVGKVYRRQFSAADLAAGVLTVSHNLNEQIVVVQVSNNLNQIISPDLITLTSSTTASINLSSFLPLAGNWNVIVRA
jgi:hypothetical protein